MVLVAIVGWVCLLEKDPVSYTTARSTSSGSTDMSDQNHAEVPSRKLMVDFSQPGRKRPQSYYSDTYLPRARSTDDKDALAKKWGSWKLVDSTKRPVVDYDKYDQKDIPASKFPKNAWQRDKAYLKDFVAEGIALIERSMEAILTEYGHGKFDSSEPFDERAKMFSITFDPDIPTAAYNYKNAGFTFQSSWEGLKRRILHSIMTEDTFTFVMGGHSAAAGHGNAFVQTYTPQLQRYIEPVFARLGVKFTSHNIGMGGLGTLQNSLGASDIYGKEIDMLMWDSGMTEKGGPDVHVFMRQSILGSNRVPFLMDDRGIALPYHDQMGADVGSFAFNQAGFLGIKTGVDEASLKSMPWAAQGLQCDASLKPLCKEMEYRSVCWVDRDDIEPSEKQAPYVGGRAGWHPGERFHKIKGAVLAFVILRALHEIFMKWQETPDALIPDDAWHVSAYYKDQMDKFGPVMLEECLKSLAPDMPCKVRMNARTEFTPRANPELTSIRSIMKDGHGMIGNLPNEYDPPDTVDIPHAHPPPEAFDALSVIELGVDFAPNVARKRLALQNRRLETESHDNGRILADIKPGQGIFSRYVCGNDNCDGTIDSWCNRCGSCMLSGHNDARNGLMQDTLSGWLILNLKDVTQGGIFVKFETWHFAKSNDATKDFKCIDGATDCSSGRLLGDDLVVSTTDTEASVGGDHDVHRSLKPPVPAYCEDFKFEFAIDGKITAWDKEEFQKRCIKAQRVVEIVTLMDDPNFRGPKDVEVAFRITSSCGREGKHFSLSHVYWA